MTQLSLKEAKRLSIIKWEAHVKAGGFCVQLPVEIHKLRSKCGFCERWKDSTLKFGVNCEKCEFAKVAGICESEDEKDLFSIWEIYDTVENAQAILNIIKSTPDE